MALAPEWMSYTKDGSSSQGSRVLGRERERVPKYGRQLSHNNLSYAPSQTSYSLDPDREATTAPFACSLSSPPAPPQSLSILGDPGGGRVLNRSKSSPGFGSPKSNKPKKSPDRPSDRNFPSFNKPKPKPPKPTFSPSSYGKSQSQPNLFNNEKTANWHQGRLQHSSSNIPPAPSPLGTSHAISPPPVHTSPVPPSTSPPLPPSSSPPPEIDKLKQLIPTTKPVRTKGVVGPPLNPLAKKAAPPISSSTTTASASQPPSASSTGIAATPPVALGLLRKYQSEPSLMHHKAPIGAHGGPSAYEVLGAQQVPDAAPAQPVRRSDAATKKARAEAEKAQSQLLKEAVDTKIPKRRNFFQHIIKQEEQGVPMEDDSPIGIDQTTAPEPQAYTPSISPPPPTSTPPPPSSPPAGLRSPLPEDMEDEERFLRTLGWVPDEEDPVPVLAEEEMADVRVKIFLSKTRGREDDDDGVSMGIDVGAK